MEWKSKILITPINGIKNVFRHTSQGRSQLDVNLDKNYKSDFFNRKIIAWKNLFTYNYLKKSKLGMKFFFGELDLRYLCKKCKKKITVVNQWNVYQKYFNVILINVFHGPQLRQSFYHFGFLVIIKFLNDTHSSIQSHIWTILKKKE